jgi:hypothetical protein
VSGARRGAEAGVVGQAGVVLGGAAVHAVCVAVGGVKVGSGLGVRVHACRPGVGGDVARWRKSKRVRTRALARAHRALRREAVEFAVGCSREPGGACVAVVSGLAWFRARLRVVLYKHFCFIFKFLNRQKSPSSRTYHSHCSSTCPISYDRLSKMSGRAKRQIKQLHNAPLA